MQLNELEPNIKLVKIEEKISFLIKRNKKMF